MHPETTHNSTDALSTQCHTAQGLVDARQVALTCFATQVGIQGHRDTPPTLATWNRPLAASNTGVTTTLSPNQVIPPGPVRRRSTRQRPN
eukprot:2764171-Amphidinium_carterae.2